LQETVALTHTHTGFGSTPIGPRVRCGLRKQHAIEIHTHKYRHIQTSNQQYIAKNIPKQKTRHNRLIQLKRYSRHQFTYLLRG